MRALRSGVRHRGGQATRPPSGLCARTAPPTRATDWTLTTRPMVARTPNFMAGESLTFTYRVEADTLRLTLRPPWAPDTGIRYTLVRLE